MSFPPISESEETPADGVTSEAPAPDPSLAGHLDTLVQTLVANVTAALSTGSADAVHVARVSTRRLKAATDLLHPIFPKKARNNFDKATRRVRRCLGPARDAEVLIGHLRDFVEEDADHRTAADWLTTRFAQERDEALNRARADKLVPRIAEKVGPWLRLREHLLLNGEVVDALLADALHDGADSFAANADALAAVRETESQGHDRIDPHAVRIAGKAMRYTVEMAQAHGVDLGERVTKSFKHMQDALGLWHDHVVLCERAMQLSSAELLAHHNSPVQRSVLSLAAAALKEADRQLDKFVSLWTENGQALMESVRAALPPRQSQTDRDPSDSVAPAAPDGPH